MPSPPRPRRKASRARARCIAVCAVVPGLILGFVAGVQLARSQRDAPARVRSEAAQAARAPGPRAESRRGPEAPSASATALRDDHEAIATTEPQARAAAGAGHPTRRSVRAEIEATDPVAWLARFGPVEVAPVTPRP